MCVFQRNHADDMISRINMQNLTGNGLAQRRQQSQSGTADFFLGNVTLQRGIQFSSTQNFAEIADT